MAVDYPVSELRRRVKARRAVDLRKATVHASVIRDILLPPAGEGGSNATPAGLILTNGTIRGRINLNDATAADGSPLAPLELRDCTLEGGFSGRHGRFSRLSFNDCRFATSKRLSDADLATIDLAGAEIATDLEMLRMRPESAADSLWISVIAARIDGSLTLNGTRLRRPERVSVEALDLTLCEIRGDAMFDHPFECAGRIKGREVQIDGDVWFRGAKLDGRAGEADERKHESLFFQSARVGGVFVLQGAGTDLREFPFTARGEVNLHQLRLGGRFYVGEARIEGSCDSSGTPSDRVGLCLESASMAGGTIGSGETIPAIEGVVQLAYLEVKNDFEILRAKLGIEAASSATDEAVAARGLVARKLTMRDIRPLQCDGETDFDPRLRLLSIDLNDATLGKLEIRDCRFNGYFSAPSLTCTGEMRIDGRIDRELDLEGANIGGSLDISRLRMGRGAKLSLKDGNIARALRLAHRPERGEAQPVELVAARETVLRCLPGASLLETLWRYRADTGEEQLRQHAFLQRHDVIRALDRRADTLRRYIVRYSHNIRSVQAAAEYIRLYCAYGPSDSSVRWLLAGKKSLPPYLEFSEGAAKPRPARTLPAALFAFSPAPVPVCKDELYAFEGCFLLDDAIGRGRVAVTAGADRPTLSFERIGKWYAVDRQPVSDGPSVMHPAEMEPANPIWVMPAVLDGAAEAPPNKLKAIDKRLRPHLRSDFSVMGKIDLRDLTCDTLDDQGGRFWGRQEVIEMNHFVYRQATWEPDEQEAPTAWQRLQRLWTRIKAERAPDWSIGDSERERLRERTDIWSPWQLRRNWIYQQFAARQSLLSPARHRVKWREYRPQPFDQAARVARAEGRDEFAIEFEILRRRIDWDLFGQRTRWMLGILGIIVACIFLLARDGASDFWLISSACAIVIALMLGWRFAKRTPWWFRRVIYGLFFTVPVGCVFLFGEWDRRPLDFAVAATIFTVIRFSARISDRGMRWMFGYLRRPVNAIYALALAFLIGWLGVSVANRMDMLVVETTPVATAAGAEVEGQGQRLVMVSPGRVHSRPFIHNVPCAGTISEPLYALDVLIPLLDLRQESRCDVAQVHDDQVEANSVAARANGQQSERWPTGIWQRLVAAYDLLVLQVSILPQKESFWLGLKALYAIAGWFLISLSILTFANINPARSESG